MEVKEYPWMSAEEIEALDIIISRFPSCRCLEWGSGGSTLYFPNKHKNIGSWTSLEHNKEWYESVKSAIKETNTFIIYKDFPEYITYPKVQFDFILVDGRKRVECIKHVFDNKLLAKDGVLVLHDSVRARYKEADNIFINNKELVKGVPLNADGSGEYNGLKLFRN